jgi:hypothetical protein
VLSVEKQNCSIILHNPTIISERKSVQWQQAKECGIAATQNRDSIHAGYSIGNVEQWIERGQILESGKAQHLSRYYLTSF